MTYDEAKVYAWQAFQSRQPSLEDVIHAIRNAVNAQTAKLERELKETDLLLEAKLSRKTADVPYSVRTGMDRALPEDLPEWLRDFTDRERDEIKFAKVYAIQFAHGTVGHSRLILIAKLADKLNTSELMRTDPQALQMNGDELRSYQKELGECEILVKNLESDKAALTRELEAALTASQAREARLREALTEARVKVNSRAINLEDNDEFVLADEYHRVLKQIDAALDTERGS